VVRGLSEDLIVVPPRNSRFTSRNWLEVVLLAMVLLVPACAGRRQPVFAPAAREEAERAVAAWRQAVAKADARGPARLLYEARVSQGPFRMSGTLAVSEKPGSVEAVLSGPFGDPIARYGDGALRGNGIRPIAIEPDELRSLLAGVWRGSGDPDVQGIHGHEALLHWSEGEEVEGILDVEAARFKSIQVTRSEGAITVEYPGDVASWPQRIELRDRRSGNALRLVLVAAEPE
jgi:hypothetical protein